MQFTRRELGRVASLGAAGWFAAPSRAQDNSRRVGYCIVGLGRIADHFMPATKASRLGRVTALVSGHRDKADRIAAQYGVPARNIYNYQNYDAIADNREIDAVYIALPNSMHAEYTIRAAKAGKHVLCEKPMATTVADAQAMIDACRQAGKKLMIGYRCQYEPTNLRAVELIRSGALGKVHAIEAGFGFDIEPGEWRLQKAMAGGGPLMDVGIYALNACRYLTGEEPNQMKAVASVITQDGRFKEVEENLTWTMSFPSGILANCSTSYGVNLTGHFRVFGTKGEITAEPAFNYEGLRLTGTIQGRPPINEPNQERDPAQFVREADHFAECILQGKQPHSPGEEGLRDMKLMEQIYRSCGRA